MRALHLPWPGALVCARTVMEIINKYGKKDVAYHTGCPSWPPSGRAYIFALATSIRSRVSTSVVRVAS